MYVAIATYREGVGQGRILQRFKVFSAHHVTSQAYVLITFNLKCWVFSSLIFVISAQSEFFFFFFSVDNKLLFFNADR